MNAVEIEEAISALAEQTFDAAEFPFAFLQAWTCPRLVENHCLSLCFVFEYYGAFVAEGRMPADGIIKAVDISGDRMFSLAA